MQRGQPPRPPQRRPQSPQSRKKPSGVRVKPRFFLFFVLIILVVALVWRGLLMLGTPSIHSGSATVQENIIGSQFQGEAVIVRDEMLTDAESITRIDFVAEEGSRVYKGNVLCQVYSSGYNQTEINRLDSYRERIKEYHRSTVIHNYSDPQLERLDDTIATLALGVRTQVQGDGVGSLTNTEKQLTATLSSRQTYLRQKYPDDQQLSSLYDEETRQLRKIDSWTTTFVAPQECLVSFYTDGYELSVNAQTYANLSPAEVRTVLAGQKLDIDTVSRGRQPIYRTVKSNAWFALVISHEKNWNPIVGQTYKMQLEGFESYLVNAVVESFTRASGDLLVRMRIDSEVRPVLNIRTCRVVVGEFVDGLSVPINALRYENEMIGVVVRNANLPGGGMFVPVVVISQDARTAFIRPVSAGSLNSGQEIMTFDP